MGNQDKFTLLIRKSKAFICLLVDDKSHKSTSPNCWCFRNGCLTQCNSLITRAVFNHEIKLCEDAWCQPSSTSDRALWPQLSFRHQRSSLCGTQDVLWSDKAKVAWHLMAGSHFSGAVNGLGAFSDRDLRCSGEYYPLLVKDAKEKRVYDILLPEIPAFTEESSPWQCDTVFSCVFWVARQEKVWWLLKILAQEGKRSPGSQVVKNQDRELCGCSRNSN